ncbi:MAG TPA: CDP-diacylglycerol diphosphatase, partial [Xanthomonadaceae bacterium]|nr:CDP-diacylglycerol diphosphatase [Xanthomonadaceae bacterium]
MRTPESSLKSRSTLLPLLVLLVLLVLLLLGACAGTPRIRHAADPGALWRIVNAHCLAADRPRALDCVAVWPQPQRRSAVLKDAHGDFQYLLLPIDRVTGIEDPQLLQPGSPNYFAAAWQARSFVEQALGRQVPRRYLSLALNSPHGRSQEQLHIHVDCIRADVRGELDAMAAEADEAWRPLSRPLRGHRYLARRVA